MVGLCGLRVCAARLKGQAFADRQIRAIRAKREKSALDTGNGKSQSPRVNPDDKQFSLNCLVSKKQIPISSMKTGMMKMMSWVLFAVAIAAVNSQFAVRSYAGLFKLDFGQLENEKEILDADGNPTGMFPEPLTNWNVIPTWTFTDPNANVIAGSASIVGTANAAGTEVTWKLKDFSTNGDNDVTLTMFDNKALSEQVNPDSPPYMMGQTANNPGPQGLAAVYDGVLVPAIVKDDYLYRNPDTAGTEVLMRFANLNPGFYNVTVFEGRTNDVNGRFGKVWVDDINGRNEPAAQNTGNYSGVNDGGIPVPLGQPSSTAACSLVLPSR